MARKSKGFGDLVRQQQNSQGERQVINKLKQKLKESGVQVTTREGGLKMSEVLEEFAEPYAEKTKNQNELKMLYQIAVLAWNIAVLPKAAMQMLDQMIKDNLSDEDPLAVKDIKELVEELIERKQMLFPDIRRLIMDFELQRSGSSYHLAVSSTEIRSA